jgi:hypothetical protein
MIWQKVHEAYRSLPSTSRNSNSQRTCKYFGAKSMSTKHSLPYMEQTLHSESDYFPRPHDTALNQYGFFHQHLHISYRISEHATVEGVFLIN